MSQCGKIAVLFVATMLGFVIPATYANEAETAVKDVIEALAKDLSRGNLESLLAHFAEERTNRLHRRQWKSLKGPI